MQRSFLALGLFLSTGIVAAQTAGPQLFNVTPPGARHGDTVEVTVSGAALEGAESLIFSNPAVKAELVGDTKVAQAPKDKNKASAMKGGMKAAPKATGAVKFKVAVPKEVPAGTLDVRVVSKGGVSNPRAFMIGDLPEVDEKEPNNDVPEAQKIDLDTTVNGVIATPTDVDYVRFAAKAGQAVVVSCLTSSIDSKLPADLVVATASGQVLAAGRGYRGGDAVVDFTAPTDGEYVVRLSSFAYVTGGTDHFYRLSVTTKPWVEAVFPPLWPEGRGPVAVYGRNLPGGKPDARFLGLAGRPLESLTPVPAKPAPTGRDLLLTDRQVSPANGLLDGADLPLAGLSDKPFVLFPQAKVFLDNGNNDTPEKAQPITVPCDVAGRIEKRNDRDWYAFEAKKGDVFMIDLFAEQIGSPVDAYFLLTDDKGKTIVEVDDSPDTLSPHQFYTRSDDPGRYRFSAKADGQYRVLVSTREAGVQFGARDVYVLRIAHEKPDFRLAVMPYTPHIPEGVTVAKGGTVLLSVFVVRMDGFDGPVKLSAENLPAGVTCPDQVVGPQQTRGTLVLTADDEAEDWVGFVSIKGSAKVKEESLEHVARPFSVTWPMPGNNGGPPNTPVISRLDRGPGLALAVRGEALFTLAPASTKPLAVKAGEKVEVTLKLTRKEGMKDPIQVHAGTVFTDKRNGGNPPPPLATFDGTKSELKVSLDVPNTLPSGTYSVVFRGVIPDGAGKNNQAKPPKAAYATAPITIEVAAKDGAKPVKRKMGQ